MSDTRHGLDLSRFDAADYLTSPEAVAEYLRAAMEEAGDDMAYMSSVLGDIVRARGVLELSNRTGITRQGLYKALAPKGNPSFVTVLRVLDALGLALVPVAKAGQGLSNAPTIVHAAGVKRAATHRTAKTTLAASRGKAKAMSKLRRSVGEA